MAFVEFEFVDVEYNEHAENVAIEILIKDDVLGERKHKTVLGAKHFRGRNLDAVTRDALIMDLMRQEVANIHAKWEDTETARAEEAAAVKTKLQGFERQTDLPTPNIPRRGRNN